MSVISVVSIIKRALSNILIYVLKLVLHINASFYQQIFSTLYNKGYYLLRRNYNLPIPDDTEIQYAKETSLVGIDINEALAFDLIENVFNTYKVEFNAFPIDKIDDSRQYYLLNGSFMAIDGNVYYSLIRHLKPHKIIEIGSGNSTVLAVHAVMKNMKEFGHKSEIICIEPYPSKMLQSLSPDIVRLIKEPVQKIDMNIFESLSEKDILFIDSSHALKSGGDVWYEYCEILPRLKTGVYVHVHDISLPKPYPKVYFDNQLYWNEQYVLQAYLTYNSKIEVVWAGNYMMCRHPEKSRSSFSPEYDLMRGKYPSSEPTSLWLRIK